MSLLDRTFDYFPRKIQELVWYYISNTASECPKNKILGGDFSTLCEKGLLRFILDMIPQHTSDSESKDPWLSFRVGPISMIVPLDPEMALEILRSNNVHRGMAYDRLVDFFGKGIFTSRDYPRWEYQREIAKQLFHTESLKKMTSELYPLLLEEVRKASQTAHGQPTDLVLLLSRVGLLAFCDSVLGIDVRDQADSLAPAVNHVLAYINGALEPVHLPFDSSYQEFKRNRDIVYDWMQMAIERVRIADREGRAPHNPLVDAIVSLTDEDRQDEVVEFTLSMVLGGHETTARLMLGALYSLMQHPHYIDQIRDEVDTYLPDDSSIPSHQDLRTKLPRLHTVIQESLRLYPPVWLLARTPKEDLSIQGHTILAGTEILISPLILHRLSSVWGSDSERFRPERFDEKIPDLYKKFLPFVAGPERCPGRDFAELESKLLIAGLLKHFDIKLSDPQQHPEPTSAGTFRLFQTLDVIIQDR
jgi:cytochrome P450